MFVEFVKWATFGVKWGGCQDLPPCGCTSRFLLVSLSVDAILHESTIYGRQKRLNKMTDGSELGDVNGVTIEWIKAQAGDKSRLGCYKRMSSSTL